MHTLSRIYKRLSPGAICLILAFMGTTSIAFGADANSADTIPEPQFDQERFSTESMKPKWSLTVGVGASYNPEYEGGGDFKITPIPVVLFTYGAWLEIDPSGITAKALEHGGFSLSGKVG